MDESLLYVAAENHWKQLCLEVPRGADETLEQTQSNSGSVCEIESAKGSVDGLVHTVSPNSSLS